MNRNCSLEIEASTAAGRDIGLLEMESEDLLDFDSIYKRWSSFVYNACLGMLGGPDDAQDAMQETFVQVYKRLGSFRGESSLKTWIYRIAINKCIEHHRRKPVNVSVLQDWLPEDGHSCEDILREIHVREAVLQLTPRHRAVIVLFYFQQLSYEEMADALGLSVNQVRMRLHRAKTAFSKIFGREDGL